MILLGSMVDDQSAVSTTEGPLSSADEETSSQGEMEILLPGVPVTADCPLTETEPNDGDETWLDATSSAFHGFTTEEIEEQQINVELQR